MQSRKAVGDFELISSRLGDFSDIVWPTVAQPASAAATVMAPKVRIIQSFPSV